MKTIIYNIKSSYRRLCLDKLQQKYSKQFTGVVLDIGGRDRGKFKKPKHKVEKWIFADINPNYKPDIVLDIQNMPQISDNSVDTISAMEIFEHVEKPEAGLSECHRVLKNGGKILISVPFLYQIHADPYDFQRWTKTKWQNELTKLGFQVEKIEIMGRFFTVKNNMKKTFILTLPPILRHISYFLIPFWSLENKLDKLKIVKNHKKLGNYHGGYFIIAKKTDEKISI